jgi:hypothetical protein
MEGAAAGAVDDDFEVAAFIEDMHDASVAHKLVILGMKKVQQAARHAQAILLQQAENARVDIPLQDSGYDSPTPGLSAEARVDERRKLFLQKQQLGPFFEAWKWVTGIWPLVKGLFKLLMWIIILITVSYTVSVFRETCIYWIQSFAEFTIEIVRAFAANLPSASPNSGAKYVPPPKVHHP